MALVTIIPNPRCLSVENLHSSIDLVCAEFGFPSLKNEQFHCIQQFLCERDTFVNVTGWGKSLIFQMAPFVEMSLGNVFDSNLWRRKAILLVIVVRQLQAKGISPVYVTADQDEQVLCKIERGEHNLVFMSPEPGQK